MVRDGGRAEDEGKWSETPCLRGHLACKHLRFHAARSYISRLCLLLDLFSAALSPEKYLWGWGDPRKSGGGGGGGRWGCIPNYLTVLAAAAPEWFSINIDCGMSHSNVSWIIVVGEGCGMSHSNVSWIIVGGKGCGMSHSNISWIIVGGKAVAWAILMFHELLWWGKAVAWAILMFHGLL